MDKNTFAHIDPRSRKPSSKIPSALNSTILDYYNKYGQNRDLERYLRFRNRSSSGSSSIQLSPTGESYSNRVGKSLENLNILQSCLESEKNVQKSKSNESLSKPGMMESVDTNKGEQPDENAAEDNQVKMISSKAVKSKKIYNINMDTSIEITFPPQLPQQTQQQQPISLPFPPSIQQMDFSQQKIEFDSCETQTERIEFPKTPNKSSEFDVVDIQRPSSVASSAASISNKQRLEWDSMADVGYNKCTDMTQFTNLTEFERKALKKFFAARGVRFDDGMLVFASKPKVRSTSVPDLGETKDTDKKRTKEKWETAFQRVLEEKYAQQSGNTKEVAFDEKSIWRSALKKFRQKYGIQFNPELDLCITDPIVHSTPILSDMSKGAIPKVRNNFVDRMQRKDEILVNDPILSEKACQTSTVSMSSKECQVSYTISDEAITPEIHGHEQCSTDNSKESEQSTDGKGIVSAASFEFFIPDVPIPGNKVNIPPWNKENVDPKKLLQAMRMEDNKEKIPARPFKDVDKLGFGTATNTAIEPMTSRTDEIFGEVSNLESDLTKGVEMLCSLADSKEIDEEKRRKLVRRLIRRMIKAKYKDSTASSESIISSKPETTDSALSKSPPIIDKANLKPNISGVSVLRSSSSSSSQKESSLSSEIVKSSTNGSKASSIKDWLKPITNSELNHERQQLILKQNEIGETSTGTTDQQQSQSRAVQSQSKSSEDSKLDSNICKFIRTLRKSQLDWIDKEICHLVGLKDYLKKQGEMDVMKDVVNSNWNGSEAVSGNLNKDSVYENVPINSFKARNHYAEVHPDVSAARRSSIGNGSRSSSSKSQTSIVNNGDKNFNSHNSKDINSHESSLEWNSHVNMQKLVRNRTKLQTPNEDITSYAHAKQQEFIGKYECIRSRPIYTQPYSSDHSEGHYSEPRDRKTSSKKTTNDAYTSITGSDVFLSSDSVSIPVANSTSNTTTHQYDTRTSVAIQTTNSLTRTAPIFKAHCNCLSICNCADARKPTIRVKTQTNDKQLQVIPKAITYDLTFDNKKKEKCINNQETDNRMRTENSLNHSARSSSSSSKDSKKNSEKNFIGNFGGCAKLSLQEHLKSARPNFVSQADERRKCLIELNNLREKRNEQRNRLFLLSSNHSLRNHIKSFKPPSDAIKHVFTTKTLKQQTRNRYNRLPEILRKEEIERQNRLKRSNRIVRDMFNKNLQKRVLKGQTNLSNSVFIAAI